MSRSSSTSSSGSSASTGSSSGSSSSSVSSRSGSSSTSRSSSSSSSSGSPSPSRRRRSRSKSKPPKRDEKERKRLRPSPKPTKVHIERLTRNVTNDHMEIFSTYGKIKMIDMPVERIYPYLSKGYAYVEFENPDEAEKALKHMDGGQIDGAGPLCVGLDLLAATAAIGAAPAPTPPDKQGR
ncbi:RNA-binding protein with serine-rich domain 1-like [Microtus ochrogaster]|uniref:RNA-binding protein with serine-rich domain 1 n=1 Tax=Microtus ochrogaster TaxID=79684 RepID=A0ABM1AR54_MICOH|nr:RNA-binding protein with serine-rich domain 1-like [Microtus ochrogaster]